MQILPLIGTYIWNTYRTLASQKYKDCKNLNQARQMFLQRDAHM